MHPVLHITPYLQLHPATVADAAEMFGLIDANRFYLRRWLPFVDSTLAVADSETYLKFVEEHAERNPVFTIQFYGKMAGLVGLKDTDYDNLRTEIGYWLAEGFQHKGIMTRCVRTLVDYAFSDLGLHRIQIRCAVGNTASKKIPRRLGFIKEGVERDGELLSDNLFTDLEVYSRINPV
jgi:ribosomal-protein-serine acetyltransferase